MRGNRAESAKANKYEQDSKRKADATSTSYHRRQLIILTIQLKTDDGLIAIVLLINYSLCFFPKGTLANFA